MNQQKINTVNVHSGAASLVLEITRLHETLSLAGSPSNALLQIPAGLLAYIISILRNETPVMPDVAASSWQQLVSLLGPHWIMPLLYWNIGHLPHYCKPPADILACLRNSFLGSNIRLLQKGRHLKKIIAALEAQGITLLAAKGFALAYTVYPHPAARPFDDIDIIIRPGDFLQARTVLENMGFRAQTHRFELLQEILFEEKMFYDNGVGDTLFIELHWYPHKSFGTQRVIDVEELFARAEKITTQELAFMALDMVDALVYASLHMLLHHTRDIRLSWIYDISMLAQKITAVGMWEEVKKRSADLGAVLAVRAALELAAFWTGLKLPEKYRDVSAWPEPSEGEKKTFNQALKKQFRPYVLLKQYLSGAPTGGKKMMLLLQLIFPTPSYMRRNYSLDKKTFLPLMYCRHYLNWIEAFMESLKGFIKR
ncbi:MAG: nucleotidyltransferase family protein [Proteobacteria bacterium]|nr:nucleotidyltransferase family protein [Pseudomonadota bacterium]